jgi:hypothetical protein
VIDGGDPRRPVAHWIGGTGGGVDRGSGVGETAKEQGEWFVGVLVVLMRAKDRALGCCSEPSTAAVRWWPAVIFWARGTGMEVPVRGVEGGAELCRDAWRS